MSRSGDGCTTCVSRGKKCDGIRPICRRCNRDRVECGGFFSSKTPIRGVSDARKPRLPPFPSIGVIDLPPSGLISSWNYPGPSRTSNVSSSEPGTPSEWSNSSSPIPTPSREPNLDYLLTENSQAPAPPISRQAPAPPYQPTDIGAFDEVTRTFLPPAEPPKKDLRQSMTTGQASLFDALFSLARPEDNVDPSATRDLDRNPEASAWASYNSGYNLDYTTGPFGENGPEDSQDAQTVGAKLCDSLTLSLDKKVKSNTLPFVLQSYALWMRQFLFEPIRIIPLARDYITDEYSEGPEARWRMMAISNAVRNITGSTEYTLEDMETLQSHMHEGFATTVLNLKTNQSMGMMEAQLAMSATYEFISMSVKVFSLSKVVKTLQAVAPIFRRACPDPGDRPVNLPSLLSNINIPLQYYAILDIILSAGLNRPMNFRYDTTYAPGVYGSVFDLENGPGIRWAYGISDRLVIILARMNALLENFGSAVDPKAIREIELELRDMKTIVVTSADPSLGVGRLVVQECWRQAAYIYLYMALCGANSHDARVVKAHGSFMEVFMRTKPGRIPDSFLVFPLPILGIATRHPDDQELLKRRMLVLPEVSRRGTAGNQFIRMLDTIWGLVNDSRRPTTWSDLRLASLYVAGV